MEATPAPTAPPLKLIGIALIGAAIAVALGIYGSQHTLPISKSILGNGLFFSGTLNMKAWLATGVATLALIQIYTALRMYSRIRIPRQMPDWLPTVHRVSGTGAFLLSLPVAYQCLYTLGFQFNSPIDTTRIAVHSVLGCFFYGIFVTKMLMLRVDGLPKGVLPLVGGLTFATVIAIWFTSAYWFFQNIGFPQF